MAIAEGLGYAHAASIIHRDVKPANVRILEDGTVKVMDFGIAKSLQTESNLTQTGITLGTSAYLAPEQIRGEAIDRRTDVFAMGVLSYELLCFRKPFRGEHLSTILYKILNETPEPIETLAPDAPPALIAAVNRALAKAPADRYPTMEELRRDLQAVYRELVGASGMYKVTQVLPDTVRAIREVADEDPTLATPSSGLPPFAITPPSGALARVPAPDATPTSASISGGARPPLELVNFRDPSAETAGDDTAVGARRTTDAAPAVRKTRLTVFAALLVLGVAGAEVYRLLNREPEARKPAPAPALPAPPAAVAPTAALEFPVPKLGEGEAAGRAVPATPPPAAAPATAAQAPAAAPAEKPAAARKFKIQFSSVPVATLSVDGKVVGPSLPARIVQLDEGEHTVRFEAKGFPTHEKKFQVGPKSDDRIHYQFPVTMLVIEALGWDGASVLVDGKFKGTLPGAARLKLAAGSYTVTLSREGMNPVTEKVTVPEGAPKTWTPPPPSPAAGGAS
jgi:hypothetical protein